MKSLRNLRAPNTALIITSLGLLVLALTPLAIFFGFFAYYQVFEPILPGVHVDNLDLSGERISPAARAIESYYTTQYKILTTDGVQTWYLSPAELGITINSYQTAQNAYDIGRTGDFSSRIEQMLDCIRLGWQIKPVVQYDPVAAQAGLLTLDAQASKPPQNASVVLQGDVLVALPGQLGYAINMEQTLKTLAADPLAVLTDDYLKIALKPVPPQVNDVSTMLGQAQALLDSSLNLKAYDPVTDKTQLIPLPKEVLASWLKFETGAQGTQISVDPNQAATFLSGLGDILGSERYIDPQRNSEAIAQAMRDGNSPIVIVSYKSSVYKVKPGDTLLKISWKLGFPMWKLLEANPGLDPDHVETGQVLNVPPKDEMLPLPVIPAKRIVINIARQRLWVYQDGKKIHDYVISTGMDRSPTQPGIFQVLVHKPNAYASVWDLTMPNFLGVYEAWPGFMNGIHGLPVLSNGVRLWADVLGRPASYGCIILDLSAAKWLYNWAENGVVVEIRP